MSSVSIETGEAPLLDNNGEISQSQMDLNLFKAAADGNVEPFKEMAREVFESSLTVQTKNTILHINIISQERENVSTKFVEEILEKCPSLLLQVNAKSDTPLHVAEKFGHSDIVRVLVERAKLPQHENEELESRVGAARQMIRMTNKEKNTALHESVCHQNVGVVEILTKEDPDYPYSANTDGKTPLYMAAESRSSDMVLALLENSTSVSHEGPNGKTALHAAAKELRFADAALPKLLEKKNNLIKETDQYGWTPIHYAAYHGMYRINALLEIDQSASNIADKDRKMTALHLAAGQGHAKIVEAIISKNPECYGLVDNRGWNFLHYAVVGFRFEKLTNLLENNPNYCNHRKLINEMDEASEASAHDGPGSVQPIQTWKCFYELWLEPGLVQAQPIFHPFLVPPLNRKESQLRISLIICPLLNSMEICVNQKQNRLWIPKHAAKQAHEPLHGPKGDFWTMIKRTR
ncbi:hypothetical protein WN944_026309 [Citrus x changshan-huyou]|uniref:Uncharacterized protein n=1 Tax=Citrus x changshan-huyou TaxID=2935761 RepID=A0AAP0LW15_9ROSI